MQSLKQFITKNRIRIESVMVDSNPNMDDSQQMDHYKVTLRRPGKQMTLYFSHGQAVCHDPEVEDVLDCLASDSSSVENAKGFEDWAREFGYDTDSRKAEKTYDACQDQAVKLCKFLGRELYEELLWKTERQ
jgi:hypothetical protein